MGNRTLLTGLKNRVDGKAFEIWEEVDGTLTSKMGDADVIGVTSSTDTGKFEQKAGARIVGATRQLSQPVAVVRPFAMASSSGAATITRAMVIQLPFKVYGLQIRLFNALAGTYANMVAAVASSANASSGVLTPVSDATSFLFSGTAAVTVPAGSGTIPNHTYGVVTSDLLSFEPVADDRGYGCTLHIRTYQPTASNTRFIRPTGSGNPTIAQNGLVAGYQTGVDGVTTWTNMTTPIATDSIPPMELVCYTDAGMRNILVGGGSTAGGQDDTTGFGWANRAANMFSAPGVMCLNYGESGAATDKSFARILAIVDSEPVKAVAWFPFSTNDSDYNTVAGALRMKGQAAKFCAEMSSRGIAPILCTFQAPTGMTGQSNTNRKAVNDFARSLANAGYCQLFDVAEILSDDTKAVGTWRDLADTTDGTHPNSVGHAKLATYAKTVFSNTLD